MFPNWVRNLFGRKTSTIRRAKPTKLDLNRARLEERLTPAFNTLITNAAGFSNMTKVTAAGTTTYTANATGASVALAEINGELSAGRNVVVDSGVGGGEAGNISFSFLGGAFNNAGAVSLTLQTGADSLVGDITLPVVTFNPGASFNVQATRNVALVDFMVATNINLTASNGAVIASSNSVFGTNLSVSAATGIGNATTPLVTQVANLEAKSATGGIFITNTGTLNIGGVTGAIDGVQATTSGDIQLINNGSIIIAGSSLEDIRATSGNVLVQALGATSDIETRNDSADAIDSNNGNVTINAGRNILLGDAVTDNFGDVEANGDLTLIAASDIIIDENTFVDAFGTGKVSATAGNSISIVASDGTTGSHIFTDDGSISLTANAFTLAAGSSINTNFNTGGDVSITADNMTIADNIDAGTAAVVLQQRTLATNIVLGGPDGVGTLGLTDAELDLVLAGTLRVGRADSAGNITLTSQISPVVAQTLSLQTGGAIVDSTAGEQADITVTNLALVAATGIGDADEIDIDAVNLSFTNSTSGLVQIADESGGLKVTSVDGIATSSSSGGGSVKAASPLTINMNVTHGASFTYTAGNNAAVAGDDLTIDNATVTLNSATNGTLRFEAGDDIVFKGTGNVVTTGATGHKVELVADTENDIVTDADGGTVTQSAGAVVSVTTNVLENTASKGIGAFATFFHFNADSISTSGNGQQFLRSEKGVTAVSLVANGVTGQVSMQADAGDITVQTVTAPNNVDLLAIVGNIFDDGNDSTLITTGSLVLSADRSIGQPGAVNDIDTKVINLNASTNGAGPFVGAPTPGIWVTESDDLNLVNASTGDGVVLIDATNNLDAKIVTANGAGRNVRLRALGGDLTVGFVSATGDNVFLSATGKIVDGDAGNDVAALGLLMSAGTGIGSAADPLETTVTNLAWNSGTGSIDLVNTGALNITAVTAFGTTITGGSGSGSATVTALSPLTVVANISMGGDVVLTASENAVPGAGDDLTVNIGIKVESTGGDVSLLAGDNIVLDNVSLVTALTAGKTVTLTAGLADNDGIGAITISGSNSVVATNLAMSAITGIGTLANPVITTVSNVEAETTTGGVFIINVGNLNIGGVSGALDGVRATTSGDIWLVNGGSVILAGTSSEDIRTASGNVLVQAVGATSDIETRNDSADAIDSDLGNVTLDAERDILLGDAATDNFGDVEANGDITLTAGRDIIIDENTFVDAFGTGKIEAIAQNNLSIIASDGTTGSRMTSQAGTISVTAIAFTLATGSKVDTTVGATDSDITITADNMSIAGTILAGTECVILQQNTASTVIDLGGADGAGTLGLTDAELDLITAGDIKIGKMVGGNINVTQPITLAIPVQLVSGTGGITSSGLGVLEIDDVILNTTGAVDLDGDNKVKNIAGTSGGDFDFRNVIPIQVTTLTICGDTFNGITAPGADITLTADSFTFNQLVVGDCVILQRATAGTFDLGTTISDTDLDFITANVLQIEGDTSANPITVSAAITISKVAVPVLDLRTTSTISNTTGTLAVDGLVIRSVGAVTLTANNVIGTVAGNSSATFALSSTGKLTVGSVTNCDGVTVVGINSNANDVTLTADDLEIANAITATASDVILTPFATGKMSLGTEVVGSLSLKNSELLLVTAGKQQFGSATAGAISLNAAVTPTSLTHFFSGSSITGAGSVTVASLAITSGDSVTLNGANDVDTLAATAKNSFAFTDSDDLTIGSVAATSVTETGVTSTSNLVRLTSGALMTLGANVSALTNNVTLQTTSAGITQPAGGILSKGLELLGTGTYSVTSATNNVDTIAGSVTGTVNYRDANGLAVGTVNTAGLNTNGNPLSLEAAGISQSAFVKASSFAIKGNGTFGLGLATNDVVSFTAATAGGNVTFRDANDLSIGAAGITTGSKQLSLQTGRSFTQGPGVVIDVGTASGGVIAGINEVSKSDTTTFVTVLGTIIANAGTGFSIRGGVGSNSIAVKPSITTPLFVFGNFPVPAEVSATISGDDLTLDTKAIVGVVGLFNVDTTNGNGVFTFTQSGNPAVEVARPVIYNSIENISGFSIAAAAVQTAKDQYQVIASTTINGLEFRGGFTGTLPPVAPFLVSPQFTNPLGPFQAPRISVGDVDGDSRPDVVIGFGLNSGSPLVTVVKGTRIFDSAKASNPLVVGDLMTQFFAYDPTFQGGVYLAAADVTGDGRAEIVTGPGTGGGPHVKIFQIDAAAPMNSNAKVINEFFPYNINFTGGVRVAAGDVNGDGTVDIVTAPGANGGPHVRVLSKTGAPIDEFFAYSGGFNGGVFVDVGDYNADGKADILTGAGFGGGPHVKVFDGANLHGAVLTEFFDDPPSTLNPTPFQDDLSALQAGVTGVGFADLDADDRLDIMVGSGIGRRTRARVYIHNPAGNGVTLKTQGGLAFDYLSNGTNYLYNNRRDGAHPATSAAFES